MNTTKTDVRKDFTYIRELMRIADRMLKQDDIDVSLGGEFEQLSLELIGSAHTLNEWIEEERARRQRAEKFKEEQLEHCRSMAIINGLDADNIKRLEVRWKEILEIA